MLTCPRCTQPLYPHLARRTDDGWRHATCPRGWQVRLAAERRRNEKLEDLRWMAETGESASGAAARTGVTPITLERFLRTYDLETWYVLRGRDPYTDDMRTPPGGCAA